MTQVENAQIKKNKFHVPSLLKKTASVHIVSIFTNEDGQRTDTTQKGVINPSTAVQPTTATCQENYDCNGVSVHWTT